MQPAELTAASFRGYPPQARQIATDNLALLREMPMAFLPLLLRELIAYDWKFPAERRELDRQFVYLGSLTAPQRRQSMQDFARLHVSRELERFAWVDQPAQFSEQLTAEL